MWYYARQRQQFGPVSEEELRRLIQQGGLSSDDLVWREGMPEWLPVSAVPELWSPVPSPPPPAPMVMSTPPPRDSWSPPVAMAPAPAMSGQPQEIVNYLPWAIAATLLCCWPAGIVSIIYANRANVAKAKGDWHAAGEAANSAKTWLIISVVSVLLLVVVGIVFMIIGETMSP